MVLATEPCLQEANHQQGGRTEVHGGGGGGQQPQGEAGAALAANTLGPLATKLEQGGAPAPAAAPATQTQAGEAGHPLAAEEAGEEETEPWDVFAAVERMRALHLEVYSSASKFGRRLDRRVAERDAKCASDDAAYRRVESKCADFLQRQKGALRSAMEAKLQAALNLLS